MANRAISIDALRGTAIVGMVLSGTISRAPHLPAWLFHAQIAPPDFAFNAQLPGITWVDLVFPFFLFAMGMAFPFAMNKQLERGLTEKKLIRRIILRSLKLFLFAVMLAHLSPFQYPQELGWIRYMMGLLAFAGFFMAFSRFPQRKNHETKINIAGYILLLLLIFLRENIWDLPFSIHKNDIIILVLANMALLGSIIWLFTRNNLYQRLAIVTLFFALRLTHSESDSWNQMIWNFNILQFLADVLPGLTATFQQAGIDASKTIFFHPEYLKYLMIIIPGTIAGDLLYPGIREKIAYDRQPAEKVFPAMASILFLNIALNLWGLLSRNVDFVWIMNIITLSLIAWLAGKGKFRHLQKHRQILLWSIFWLLLGLIFEVWEGGIKKDPATISYFFMTSGLSGFTVVLFGIMESVFRNGNVFSAVSQTGMNPMLGYVAATYFIMPLLYFLQALPWIDQWYVAWSWAGLLRGILLTGLMMLVTVYSVRKNLYWKT